jgi:putative phage-type endonuclease
MKHEFTQGSESWLAFRRTMRNASESPMVMRVSPFGGWQAVKDSKEGKGFEGNAATRHGQKHEETARQKFEEEYGLIGSPTVVSNGQYAASLDWLSHDGKTIAEFKVPYQGKNSKLWKAMEKGDCLYYIWQVQHQLMVTPSAELCVFFVLDAESGESLSIEIQPSQGHQEAIRNTWDEWEAWRNSGDAEPKKDGLLRKDELWASLADEYIKAKKLADIAAEEAERCKKALIELTDTDKEHGSGVCVTRSFRKGSIDYAKVPELRGVDLEPYRKSSTTVTTVTVEDK